MQGAGKEQARSRQGLQGTVWGEVQIPQNNGLFPALVPRMVLSATILNWCETYANQCLFLPVDSSCRWK